MATVKPIDLSVIDTNNDHVVTQTEFDSATGPTKPLNTLKQSGALTFDATSQTITLVVGDALSVTGSDISDKITANNSGDTIHGMDGNDILNGGNGKDFLFGDKGNDALYGNNGGDELNGGEGDDILQGGNGGDLLTGGIGRDKFVYLSKDDSPYSITSGGNPAYSGSGSWSGRWDVITDFTATQDTLDLSGLTLTGSGPSQLLWRGAQGNDTTAGVANSALAHSVWYYTASSSLTYLYADVDGDGKADLKIQMNVAPAVGDIITGYNPVIITSGAQGGFVVEDAPSTPSLTDSLNAAGTISFTDADLSDTHTVSFAPAAGQTALGSFTLDPVSEAVNAASGSVAWHYALNNIAAQYLAAGQSVVEHYIVTVSDGHGSTTTQDVAVTITGTNDVPVITVQDLVGAVTELVTPAGNLTDSGIIKFTDVDLTDVHLVSAT
ncbi:type I secretion C-terminal target domain (VC_A0849 subclass), partial [Bradyrhizobium sp. Rc2d]|uniref:VCBS domain-containing protein n=1 Tax=Bradyrhizobium sp. Rc2d TaxID=1855321 RepID=UPI0008908DAE